MRTLKVIAGDKGWHVEGSTSRKRVFQTKQSAIEAARKLARNEHIPLIVYSKDGKVTSVNSYQRGAKFRTILSANVKHTISNKRVRDSIAKVMAQNK